VSGIRRRIGFGRSKVQENGSYSIWCSMDFNGEQIAFFNMMQYGFQRRADSFFQYGAVWISTESR